MNRKERRGLMRENPRLKDDIEIATDVAFRNVQKMFERVWEKDDESLNQGKLDVDKNDGEDDRLNY